MQEVIQAHEIDTFNTDVTQPYCTFPQYASFQWFFLDCGYQTVTLRVKDIDKPRANFVLSSGLWALRFSRTSLNGAQTFDPFTERWGQGRVAYCSLFPEPTSTLVGQSLVTRIPLSMTTGKGVQERRNSSETAHLGGWSTSLVHLRKYANCVQ